VKVTSWTDSGDHSPNSYYYINQDSFRLIKEIYGMGNIHGIKVNDILHDDYVVRVVLTEGVACSYGHSVGDSILYYRPWSEVKVKEKPRAVAGVRYWSGARSAYGIGLVSGHVAPVSAHACPTFVEMDDDWIVAGSQRP
jgi:hypothetical protein